MGKKWLAAVVVGLTAIMAAEGMAAEGMAAAEGIAEAEGIAAAESTAAAESPALGKDAKGQSGQTDESGELTIWVDGDSECVIREALAGYYAAQTNAGTKYAEYFPELSWRIVDKSYLSGEEYRAALMDALKTGEGPDLIFVDGANGLDPEELMESGDLMELNGATEKYVTEKLSYHPAVLEAGQMEGKQYLIPVTMQYPVVFGVTEELREAGIDGETGFENLEAFLEAVLAASESSGKLIFDDASAVDWIAGNCMPQEEQKDERQDGENGSEASAETENLRALLEAVREHSGGAESFFGPYEALDSGKCLLSGCGFTAKSKLAQNLALFGEKEISFLNVPAWDGEVRGVITGAVAVNSGTPYQEEAKKLIQGFQGPMPNNPYMTEDLPATGSRMHWQEQLSWQADLAAEAIDKQYASLARKISTTDILAKEFKAHTQKAVTGAVFQRPEEKKQLDSGLEIENAGEKKVLTVAFENLGMGEEYPLTAWLESAAEEFSNETLHVQLVPLSSGKFGAMSAACFMEEAGVGTDIVLCGAYTHAGSEDFYKWYMDLTDFLQTQPEEIEGAAAGDKTRGLVWGADEKGTKYIFAVSENSLVKEEALAFCVQALKNEKYAAAVESVGFVPVG